MTLQKLISIIIEVTEQVLARYRLRVAAYAFDRDRAGEVLETAKTFNGTVESTHIPDRTRPDVLFLDSIPPAYLPQLALGLSCDPVGEYLNNMVISGGTIVVLDSRFRGMENAPPAYIALLETYRDMLKSYGCLFFEEPDSGEERTGSGVAAEAVYKGNVLSRRDLLEYAAGGGMTIGPSVLVTDLAADTARGMGININRQNL